MMMCSCPCIQKSKFTFTYGVRPFLAGVLSIVARVFSWCGSVPGYRRSFVILLGAFSKDKKDGREYLWK